MDLERVRFEMKKRKMKHQDLAKTLGVHPTTLSRFLNGKTVIRSEKLLELMRILKIKAEALTEKAS